MNFHLNTLASEWYDLQFNNVCRKREDSSFSDF